MFCLVPNGSSRRLCLPLRVWLGISPVIGYDDQEFDFL
jgi:hypothetical protein